MTPALKAEQFHSLHREGCFVLPNAWDAGSARLLASLGFQAIATTSAGLAFMLGRRDGVAAVSRAEALANAGDIAAATDLPVSADLEDGYGTTPEDCAATVRWPRPPGCAAARSKTRPPTRRAPSMPSMPQWLGLALWPGPRGPRRSRSC